MFIYLFIQNIMESSSNETKLTSCNIFAICTCNWSNQDSLRGIMAMQWQIIILWKQFSIDCRLRLIENMFYLSLLSCSHIVIMTILGRVLVHYVHYVIFVLHSIYQDRSSQTVSGNLTPPPPRSLHTNLKTK